jgi:trehalose 6-phosphate synthase
MWTKKDLEDFVKNRFVDTKLIVVSNREPFQHQLKEGKIECIKPAGGVVTALDPIMRGVSMGSSLDN